MNFIDLKSIILGYLAYCLYVYITTKTVLTFHHTEKNLKIIKSCESLKEAKFKPHFLLPTAFLQVAIFDYIKGPPEELEITREEVNGHGVYLDWVCIKNNNTSTISSLKNSNKEILLIIPGLTGNKKDTYVLNIAYEAISNNYIPVIYQNRLLSESMDLPEKAHLDLFVDLDEALDKIEAKFPSRKIFAIGFSYGSNKLVHYLGTRNTKKKRIAGAVSVGNPYDLLICQRMLAGTLFDYFILNMLKKNLKKNHHRFTQPHQKISVDVGRAFEAKSVKEFDEYTVRRVLGYKSADDYYRGLSCVHHIEKIDVPLLCISALDDNVTSAKGIPYDEASLNENIFLLVSDRGGHLCYIGNESLIQLKQWVNRPAIEFINAVKNLNKQV